MGKTGIGRNHRVENLKDITKIQCSPGNYDCDEYMRGMANGLILAVSIMEESKPKYFPAPPSKRTELLKLLKGYIE